LSDRLHLFGIRHHGPGSAHALVRELDALDPAMVLIEGPPEGEAILHAAASADLVPPVALLCYSPDDPGLAVFDPFAEYSPEWQAIRWALHRGRPVRLIDLPAGITLAMRKDGEDEGGFPYDPLGTLAEVAGQSDGETWWNGTVEQSMGQHGYFAAIEKAMSAMREDEPEGSLSLRERMREAQMRLAIAAALSETEGPVAAVVGAWHVPALRRKVALKDDRAILKGADRIKVATAWVPWTDTRLAAGSGYGAGVASPGWYRHLWEHYSGGRSGPDVRALVVGWMTKAAIMLREEGIPASTASVIEAVRLAESLAALRELPVPGLPELDDAMLSVICGGNDVPMRLIARRLVIGEQVGEVGEGLPQTPLQADLARQQRALRLKPSAIEEQASVDLRTEAGLAKSTLLHRLDLLGVKWGRLEERGRSRGTFRENWVLHWAPELSVALAEASVHGGTVKEASAGKAAATIASEATPEALAGLVQSCLHADLPSAYDAALVRLQAVAAAGGTVEALMGAVPSLADILRYGTARRFDETPLRTLVVSLCVEINVNLPYACRSLDADGAESMRKSLSRYAVAVGMLDDEAVASGWVSTLGQLAGDQAIAPGIRGFATRQLHEGTDASDVTARRLSIALSPSVPPAEGGAWLEGFLADGADILIVDMSLLSVVDAWMTGLAEGDFMALLPMLRRSLSSFDGHQRRAIRESVARGCRPRESNGSQEASPAFAEAVPLLMTILGIGAEGRTA